MNKRVLAGLTGTLLMLSLCACGNGGGTADAPAVDSEQATPPSLVGEWEAKLSDEVSQKATITDDSITVDWVVDGDSMLYWAGTYTAPTTADEPYTWDSQNDTEQTSTALMASPDETKTFTYQDGKITYDVTVDGSTVTATLEKVDGAQ